MVGREYITNQDDILTEANFFYQCLYIIILAIIQKIISNANIVKLENSETLSFECEITLLKRHCTLKEYDKQEKSGA